MAHAHRFDRRQNAGACKPVRASSVRIPVSVQYPIPFISFFSPRRLKRKPTVRLRHATGNAEPISPTRFAHPLKSEKIQPHPCCYGQTMCAVPEANMGPSKRFANTRVRLWSECSCVIKTAAIRSVSMSSSGSDGYSPKVRQSTKILFEVLQQRLIA